MSTNNLTFDEVFRHIDLLINVTFRYSTEGTLNKMWKHFTSIINYAYTSKQPAEIFKQFVTYEYEKNQKR